MSIVKMNVESDAMKGVMSFVKRMTKSMTFDENMESANWPRARRRNNFFYRLIPKLKNVKYEKIHLGKTEAMLAYAEGASDKNVILYIHGGGFVTGSAFVSKGYASMLAKHAGCKVYAVEYALAPEKPFPAGFNNCCEAFEEIMKLYPDSKITLVGESAGGNFCVGIGLKYKETGRIACVIAHSPTVDFSGIIDHGINENKDFIVMKGALDPLRRMYVGDNDPKNPYISPIYGDFKGYPPVFITCDENETLYADAKALYEKCEGSGVTVNMVVAKGTYHAFAVTGTNAPETAELLKDNMAFMKECS